MNTTSQADKEQVLTLLRNDDLVAVERMRQVLQPNVLPNDAIDTFTGWCLQQAQAILDPAGPDQPDESLDPESFPAVRGALFHAVWRNAQADPVAGWTAAWHSIWSIESVEDTTGETPDFTVFPADAAWLAAWTSAWMSGKQAVKSAGRAERPSAWAAAWSQAWTAAWDTQIAYLIDLLTA